MIETPDSRSPVALVTGASRGIGRAIAIELAAAGCAVAVNYVSNASAADAVVAEIAAGGGRAEAFRADVSDAAACADLATAVEASLGGLGILVNNAGIAPRRDLLDAEPGYFTEIFDANVRSAYLLSQATIGGMRERGWGRLVFVSSLAARVGGQISAAYASSKAALEGLMHFYATNLRPFGITANAISPGVIDTDLMGGVPLPPAAALPFGRLGRPEEVARLTIALASNAYVTGQTVQISGGIVHS